jgi:hypothetical protein
MKEPYAAPNAGKFRVFMEKSIADTTVSMKGAVGGVTQDSWDNVDTEIGQVATDPQGDLFVSY